MAGTPKFQSTRQPPIARTRTPTVHETIINMDALMQTPTRVPSGEAIIDLSSLLSQPVPAVLGRLSTEATQASAFTMVSLDRLPSYTSDCAAPSYTRRDRLRSHKVKVWDVMKGRQKPRTTLFAIYIIVFLLAAGGIAFLTVGFMKLAPKFEGKTFTMRQQIQKWKDERIREGGA